MNLLFVIVYFFCNIAFGEILDTNEINQLVEPYLQSNKFVGIAVAVVGPQNETIAFYGETQKGNGVLPNINSLFEIGSVTKAITGTLLAHSILEKKVNTLGLVQNYLSDKVLSTGKEPITVEQLATHTSGITPVPNPSLFQPIDPINPWMNFGKKELFEMLPQMDLNFKPGTKNEYSNLGAAIIGYVLEAIDGLSYEEILMEKIVQPLNLTSTSISLSSIQKQNLVSGYFNDGQGNLTPIAKWDMSGIPAAGAICSDLSDMINLSKGLMVESTPLGKAFILAMQKRADTGTPDNSIGLFWQLKNVEEYAWHNGATYGQTSFFAIHPKKKVSVIVLTNTFNLTQDETVLGFQIMKKALEKF